MKAHYAPKKESKEGDYMNKNDFNYQQWLEDFKNEAWHKFQSADFSHYFAKNKAFKTVLFHFYSQVAINNGASPNLPFKTLSLLGEKLQDPKFKAEFQKIIDQNVIKFKGQFYKLDDQIYQKRIQKAIKRFSFETEENKFAA